MQTQQARVSRILMRIQQAFKIQQDSYGNSTSIQGSARLLWEFNKHSRFSKTLMRIQQTFRVQEDSYVNLTSIQGSARLLRKFNKQGSAGLLHRFGKHSRFSKTLMGIQQAFKVQQDSYVNSASIQGSTRLLWEFGKHLNHYSTRLL
jgi:hypothetical protein